MLGIPLYVFGPETHMTAICGMALGTRPIPKENNVEFATANFLLPSGDKSDDKLNGSEKERGETVKVAACTVKEVVSFLFLLLFEYFPISLFSVVFLSLWSLSSA